MNLKPLEEMVTCPIDLNFLEDPRFLPCGHVFCRSCLDSYLRQILSDSPLPGATPRTALQLPCPICRATHSIPENRSASSFPKSFNHSMIIEYLRSQALMIEPNDLSGGPSSSHSSFYNPSPLGRRKTSFHVTSDALNTLVADLVALKRSGSSNILNLAQLLHEVRKLTEVPGNPNLPEIPEPEMVEPTAPPAPPPTPPPSAPPPPSRKTSVPRSQSKERRRQSGRFGSAVNSARGSRRSDPERSSYANYREMLTAKTLMMRNSAYRCLRKSLGQCSGLPRAVVTHSAMHLLPTRSGTHVMQYTIGADGETGVLNLWRKKVSVCPGRESFNLPINTARSPEKNPDAVLWERWGLEEIASMGKLEVQYVKCHKSHVYMTIIVRQPSPGSGDGSKISADLIDPGLVVCCTLPDPNHKFTAEEFNNNDPEKVAHNFPIVDVSSIFLRDTVGIQQMDRPIIAGLDIDRVTGAVYVALCANAMVCRLKADDLKQVEREWFLNEPQLSPSYLCLAKQENEIWASCPLEDKVFILDLATDTFTQFTPSIMLDIVPSHIIYTTDDRIMLLDKKLSRIYWLKRVQQSICSQRVDNTMKERRRRGIDIIQPVDDSLVSICLASSRTNRFCGGIMCADSAGSYLIYPRKVLANKGSSKFACCV